MTLNQEPVITNSPYIYLVEDDADDRLMMQQAFATVNFADRVRMFHSSELFLNYMRSVTNTVNLPTLFVVDFNMPVVNGGELLLKLKQHTFLKTIPVVLYSTGMRPILKEMLVASGAVDCFEKAADYRTRCKQAQIFRLIAEGNEVVY